MRIRSSRTSSPARGRHFFSLLCLSPVVLALLFPFAASAQQTLVDRLIPIFDDGAGNGVCGNVTDATLNAATCVDGFANDQASEVTTQFSGNTAAAAGSNATQTSLEQVNAQTERLVSVRTTARASSGIRSGSDGGDTSRVGGFFNFFGGFGDTQFNGEEPGFDYDGGGFTSGLDVLLNDNMVIGGGFGWNRQTSDFDNATSEFDGSSIGGGDLVADAYVFSGFGSWFEGPLYIDAMVAYTYFEYESERGVSAPRVGVVNENLDSQTDGHQATVTLGGGYQMQYNGLMVGPTAQLNFNHTMINGFNEDGSAVALRYEDQDVNSLTTSVGAEISYPVSADFGVLTPHFRLTWEHELLDDPRKIRAAFRLDDSGAGNPITTETGEPDRNYGRISLGASAQLKGGVAMFIDYETVIGLAHTEFHKFTGGARLEF